MTKTQCRLCGCWIVSENPNDADSDMARHKMLNHATRTDQIRDEVYARNGIWEAVDQGRVAAAMGQPRTSNPWNTDATRSHVNCHEWFRGWDREDATRNTGL